MPIISNFWHISFAFRWKHARLGLFAWTIWIYSSTADARLATSHTSGPEWPRPELLRSVFLAHYFGSQAFRRELLRVLNRGESANALKRAIHAGRVAGYQARQPDEMQAVADALSLPAHLVSRGNTMNMQ